MNILHITNQLDVGGITSYVLSLGAGLKARGHNIYIASSGGELLNRFVSAGFNYIPVPINTKCEISPKVLISFIKLKKAIKENNIQIIHGHSRTTQVLGYLLGKNLNIPYVSTCHGFFKPRFSRRRFPCWGRKVIAISQQVKEHLKDDFKLPEENIRVINNGVKIEKLVSNDEAKNLEQKRALALGPGPVIGIVARLSDVKGHVYLIEAMKMVVEKIPAAQLLIVGEGRMKNQLTALTKKLELERNIIFIPSVMSMEILAVMDIFAMPSLQEGLGLSLMEAMSAALAVVASRVGGIISLVKDGETGLLVKPADSRELAQALVELLQDPQKRALLGYNAHNFIAQNFSLEKQVLDTERFYQECLN